MQLGTVIGIHSRLSRHRTDRPNSQRGLTITYYRWSTIYSPREWPYQTMIMYIVIEYQIGKVKGLYLQLQLSSHIRYTCMCVQTRWVARYSYNRLGSQLCIKIANYSSKQAQGMWLDTVIEEQCTGRDVIAITSRLSRGIGPIGSQSSYVPRTYSYSICDQIQAQQIR